MQQFLCQAFLLLQLVCFPFEETRMPACTRVQAENTVAQHDGDTDEHGDHQSFHHAHLAVAQAHPGVRGRNTMIDSSVRHGIVQVGHIEHDHEDKKRETGQGKKECDQNVSELDARSRVTFLRDERIDIDGVAT